MKICKINNDNVFKVLQLDNAIFDYDKYNLETLKDFLTNDNYINLCAIIDDEIVGYIIVFSIFDEGCLIKIATNPKFQNNGIATKLFNTAKEELLKKGVTNIYLEVSSENTVAINFYNKKGFVTESVRKSYYNNGDDALIMWLRDL